LERVVESMEARGFRHLDDTKDGGLLLSKEDDRIELRAEALNNDLRFSYVISVNVSKKSILMLLALVATGSILMLMSRGRDVVLLTAGGLLLISMRFLNRYIGSLKEYLIQRNIKSLITEIAHSTDGKQITPLKKTTDELED